MEIKPGIDAADPEKVDVELAGQASLRRIRKLVDGPSRSR